MNIQDAIGAGKKRYFSGKTCPKGHTADRFVSTRGCCECALIGSKKWATKNVDRASKRKAMWYEKNRDKQTEATLQNKYQIGLQDYLSMLNAQGGVCAICLAPPKNNKRLQVDHCHSKGRVRGLLCINCNSGIGRFDDNIEVMKRAISYVESHK